MFKIIDYISLYSSEKEREEIEKVLTDYPLDFLNCNMCEKPCYYKNCLFIVVPSDAYPNKARVCSISCANSYILANLLF